MWRRLGNENNIMMTIPYQELDSSLPYLVLKFIHKAVLTVPDTRYEKTSKPNSRNEGPCWGDMFFEFVESWLYTQTVDSLAPHVAASFICKCY